LFGSSYFTSSWYLVNFGEWNYATIVADLFRESNQHLASLTCRKKIPSNDATAEKENTSQDTSSVQSITVGTINDPEKVDD
jgi:hypothetical protein